MRLCRCLLLPQVTKLHLKSFLGCRKCKSTSCSTVNGQSWVGSRGISSVKKISEPSWDQMKIHMFTAAVPMVAFGWMDNTVMIQAGELIDDSLGVTFGLSTLTAAAFGQVFSDLSGVCFGGTVEAIATRLGLPTAHLTVEQMGLGSVRFFGTLGRAVGVVTGCLLGMTSLLFMDLDKTEAKKRQTELGNIVAAISAALEKTIRCRVRVYFYDQESGEVFRARSDGVRASPDDTIKEVSSPLGFVLRTGQALNIRDCKAQILFDCRNYETALYYPIFDETDTHVIGVLAVSDRQHATDVPTTGNFVSHGSLASKNDEFREQGVQKSSWWQTLVSSTSSFFSKGSKSNSKDSDDNLEEDNIAIGSYLPFRRQEEQLVKLASHNLSLCIAFATNQSSSRIDNFGKVVSSPFVCNDEELPNKNNIIESMANYTEKLRPSGDINSKEDVNNHNLMNNNKNRDTADADAASLLTPKSNDGQSLSPLIKLDGRQNSEISFNQIPGGDIHQNLDDAESKSNATDMKIFQKNNASSSPLSPEQQEQLSNLSPKSLLSAPPLSSPITSTSPDSALKTRMTAKILRDAFVQDPGNSNSFKMRSSSPTTGASSSPETVDSPYLPPPAAPFVEVVVLPPPTSPQTSSGRANVARPPQTSPLPASSPAPPLASPGFAARPSTQLSTPRMYPSSSIGTGTSSSSTFYSKTSADNLTISPRKSFYSSSGNNNPGSGYGQIDAANFDALNSADVSNPAADSSLGSTSLRLNEATKTTSKESQATPRTIMGATLEYGRMQQQQQHGQATHQEKNLTKMLSSRPVVNTNVTTPGEAAVTESVAPSPVLSSFRSIRGSEQLSEDKRHKNSFHETSQFDESLKASPSRHMRSSTVGGVKFADRKENFTERHADYSNREGNNPQTTAAIQPGVAHRRSLSYFQDLPSVEDHVRSGGNSPTVRSRHLRTLSSASNLQQSGMHVEEASTKTT